MPSMFVKTELLALAVASAVGQGGTATDGTVITNWSGSGSGSGWSGSGSGWWSGSGSGNGIVSGSESGSGSGSGSVSGSGSGWWSGSGSGSGSVSGSGSGWWSGSGSGSGSVSGSGSGWWSGSGSGSGSVSGSGSGWWSGSGSGSGSISGSGSGWWSGSGSGSGSGSVVYELAEPNMGCQRSLTSDECEQASSASGEYFITLDTQGLPYGCSIQMLDNAYIYNYAYGENFDSWETNTWCPQGSDEVCILKAVCQILPWDTRTDGTSCPMDYHLSYDECRDIVATENEMFWSWYSDAWGTTDANLPHGCYGDRVNDYIGYNTNPLGYLDDFDSSEDGYFYWPMCDTTMTTPSPTPVVPTPPPTPAPTQEEQNVIEFVLQNKHGGFCFDAKRRRDRGGTVHMWECKQKGDAIDWNRNQHWSMEVVSDDRNIVTGPIKSHDGICLDASEAENGGKVWMWPCKRNNKRQHWTYHKVTGQLQSANGYCLDARQRMTMGGMVHMWTCTNDEKNQQFNMLQNPDGFDYTSKMDYSENLLATGSWWGEEPPPSDR